MQAWLLYIDPGSGSYLVQVIVAAALGVAFFFRNIIFDLLWPQAKQIAAAP